jgi:hypothetical protein
MSLRPLAEFGCADKTVATSTTAGYLDAPHRPAGGIGVRELLLSRGRVAWLNPNIMTF